MLACSYLTSIDSNEQNYSAGDPTPVLYIKNLAKDVVVDDLYFIFGEFGLSPCSDRLSVVLLICIQKHEWET